MRYLIGFIGVVVIVSGTQQSDGWVLLFGGALVCFAIDMDRR